MLFFSHKFEKIWHLIGGGHLGFLEKKNFSIRSFLWLSSISMPRFVQIGRRVFKCRAKMWCGGQILSYQCHILPVRLWHAYWYRSVISIYYYVSMVLSNVPNWEDFYIISIFGVIFGQNLGFWPPGRPFIGPPQLLCNWLWRYSIKV